MRKTVNLSRPLLLMAALHVVVWFTCTVSATGASVPALAASADVTAPALAPAPPATDAQQSFILREKVLAVPEATAAAKAPEALAERAEQEQQEQQEQQQKSAVLATTTTPPGARLLMSSSSSSSAALGSGSWSSSSSSSSSSSGGGGEGSSSAPSSSEDGDASSDSDDDQMWIVGVALSAFCSLLSALGIGFQKLSFKNGGCNRPQWYGGLALIVLGTLLDFAAFGLAPQSLIAPLASLTLVWNMSVACWFLGEQPSKRDVQATIVIIIGTASVVASASHTDGEYTLADLKAKFERPVMAAYFVVVGGALLVNYLLVRGIERRGLCEPGHHPVWPRLRLLGYGGLAGGLGGQSALFAKSAVEILKSTLLHGDDGFLHPEAWMIVGALVFTLLSQLRFLNAGLRSHDQLAMVPVYQSCWILSSVMGGLVYFDEIEDLAPAQGALFAGSTLLTISGVALLATRTMRPAGSVPLSSLDGKECSSSDDDDDDDDDEKDLELGYSSVQVEVTLELPQLSPSSSVDSLSSGSSDTASAPAPGPGPEPATDAPFELGPRLGKDGTQGAVYVARGLADAAVKVSENGPAAWAEVRALRAVQPHPNIIRLRDVTATAEHVFAVLQLCPGGDLLERITALPAGRLPEAQALARFAELRAAVAHCHAHDIAHRDIKLENLLVDAGGALVLADFGLACAAPAGTLETVMVGTPEYAAPEIVAGQPYDPKATDLWSCGVVLYAMLCGRFPFSSASPSDDNYAALVAGEMPWPEFLSAESVGLLEEYLVVSPGGRGRV